MGCSPSSAKDVHPDRSKPPESEPPPKLSEETMSDAIGVTLANKPNHHSLNSAIVVRSAQPATSFSDDGQIHSLSYVSPVSLGGPADKVEMSMPASPVASSEAIQAEPTAVREELPGIATQLEPVWEHREHNGQESPIVSRSPIHTPSLPSLSDNGQQTPILSPVSDSRPVSATEEKRVSATEEKRPLSGDSLGEKRRQEQKERMRALYKSQDMKKLKLEQQRVQKLQEDQLAALAARRQAAEQASQALEKELAATKMQLLRATSQLRKKKACRKDTIDGLALSYG